MADRPLADARDEVLDDLEVDVRLEQRQPDLAHGGIDVGLADPAAAGQRAEGLAQPVAEGVEHGPGQDSVRGGGPGPATSRAGWYASSDAPSRRSVAQVVSERRRPMVLSAPPTAPMLRPRAQSVRLTALAQLGVRPSLVRRDDLDLRVAHHPDRPAARRDPRAGLGRDRGRVAARLSSSARRSSSGSWQAPGSIGCAGGRCSSGPISGGRSCSGRCRSPSRSAS